jgi:hypothetical protein
MVLDATWLKRKLIYFHETQILLRQVSANEVHGVEFEKHKFRKGTGGVDVNIILLCRKFHSNNRQSLLQIPEETF